MAIAAGALLADVSGHLACNKTCDHRCGQSFYETWLQVYFHSQVPPPLRLCPLAGGRRWLLA